MSFWWFAWRLGGGLAGMAVAVGVTLLLQLLSIHLPSPCYMVLGAVFALCGYLLGLLMDEGRVAREYAQRRQEAEAIREEFRQAQLKDIAEGSYSGRNVWAAYLKERKP